MYPLISCLCVTKGKPSLLLRAIDCFLSQNYPSKELVIIYEDDDIETLSFFKRNTFQNPAIRIFEIPVSPKKTLGELRNISIESAQGTYICQWDDDDWYHSDRLKRHYERMVTDGCRASVLTRWLVFDQFTAEVFISNRRSWEGSLLCDRELAATKGYENLAKGEDTALIDHLFENGYLHMLEDLPSLYIYVYHGNNTWSYEHFSAIFDASVKLSGQGPLISDILAGVYTPVQASKLIDDMLAIMQ